MKLLIVLASIFVPIILLYLKHKFAVSHLIFNAIAVVSALIFGDIAAISLYNVIVDGAVFMTTIHGIFLNPLFMMTGAYLGLYMIYLLIGALFQVNSLTKKKTPPYT